MCEHGDINDVNVHHCYHLSASSSSPSPSSSSASLLFVKMNFIGRIKKTKLQKKIDDDDDDNKTMSGISSK